MRRLAALAAAALLAAPAGAAASPLLAPADAEELAVVLAEAEEAQGICYGWHVEIDDDSGSGLTGVDVGSSRGPDVPVNEHTVGCRGYAVVTASIRYTSESSESEDSAGLSVDTDLGQPVSSAGLERLGLTAGDLLGGGDDVSLINMAGALPLLAAESGAAPHIPYQANRGPLRAGEVPTGNPGSDWWRKFWPHVVVATALSMLAGGVIGWLAGGGLRTRSQPPPTARARHARARPRLP